MTSPVIVVQPIKLIDAMLISATVGEADHSVWSAATSYAPGVRVIKTIGSHRIFESIAGGNIGRDPATSPGFWLDVSPTNRWAMFDGSHSTVTTAPAGSMSYTLRPGSGITALAALSLRGATSLRVRLTHPVLGLIYDKTNTLSSMPIASGWWGWFFGTRAAPPLMVATDLPGIPGCDLIVDFTGTSELAVGVLLFGQMRSIGLGMLQGARLGNQDYSRKETNAFGDVVLVQRAYAARVSLTVPVRAEHVDATKQYLTSLRAQPCLWIGAARYASSIVYGYYKEFEITISGARVSECSLQIEGLT